jgi:hypothetical protein
LHARIIGAGAVGLEVVDRSGYAPGHGAAAFVVVSIVRMVTSSKRFEDG